MRANTPAIMRRLPVLGLSLLALLLLGGCQTVGGWFSRSDPALEPAGLVDFEPTARVERVWSANTGRGSNRSRPNFRPFVIDGEVWVGDHRGRITVIDMESGRRLQGFDTGLELSAGPAVYGDRVLLGTFDGLLVVLDRSSGNVQWQAQLSSEVLAYPVIHDGVVLARCIDGRLFGLDQADGRRLWIHDRSVPLLTLRGNSDPLVRAGLVYIGHEDGAVTALRVSDGTVLWEQRVSEPEGRTELDRLADIDGPMQIVGGELYATSYHGRLAGMAIDSGSLLWVADLASATGVSVERTRLAAADKDDAVWLVDRRNGTTIWRDDQLARRQITRPVFFGDWLVTADAEGYLHFYDDQGAFAVRTRAFRGEPSDAPVVVGNRLLLLDKDGTLTAWRAERRG